jgi:hypothetical protein
VIIDAIKYFQGQMDHLNKSENIDPTNHGDAERRKGGRTLG